MAFKLDLHVEGLLHNRLFGREIDVLFYGLAENIKGVGGGDGGVSVFVLRTVDICSVGNGGRKADLAHRILKCEQSVNRRNGGGKVDVSVVNARLL